MVFYINYVLIILILIVRISISQPRDSRNATKCATKCVNDMEKLAQLKRACKTMTSSKCSSHLDLRTEGIPKSRRKCFRVNINRSSTKSAECVELLKNTRSQTQIKSCYTFVCFCISQDVVKFLEMRNAGARFVQKTMPRLIRSAARNTSNLTSSSMGLIRSSSTNSSTSTPQATSQAATQATTQATPQSTTQATPQATTQATPQATTQATTQSTTQPATSSASNFFDDWTRGLLVAAGALIVLLVSAFTVVLFKYRKRQTSGRNANCMLELRPVSPTLTLGQNSPVCCEADTFQSAPSRDLEHRSSGIVETEVDMSTADVEGNSEHEYCYPDSIEDKYEIMNPAVDPVEASGEYARAYDHTIINTGYMNEDGYEVPCDYVYPQNTGVWRDSGFKEATLSFSEPPIPLNKDNVDDNFYENNQILLRESLENENETNA